MAASVAVPRLLSDAVEVAKSDLREDRDYTAAFRSDAPLRILVTRRTAHDRVMVLLQQGGVLDKPEIAGDSAALAAAAPVPEDVRKQAS